MRRRASWLLVCLVLACGERDRVVSTVTVSGRVRLDALAFAGGVTVEVLTADGTPTGDETTSDSAGRFAVEVPARSEVYFRCTALGCVATNSRIVATAESALEDVELWVFTLAARTAAATGVDLASSPHVTADTAGKGLVVGVLYDQSGYAATGATVALSTAVTGAGTDNTAVAYIDGKGVWDTTPFTTAVIAHQFAAVNVPPGEFELTQSADSTSVRAPSFAGEVTALVVRGLPVYCALIGAVIDEAEQGVAGATVQALDADGVVLAETTSASDSFAGTFAITGLTTGDTFHLHATGVAGRVDGNSRYYTIADEPLLVTGVLLVSDTYYDSLLEEMRLDLDFTRVDSKAVLAARLTDTKEIPVVGETVTMQPASGTAGYLDSDGSFDDDGVGFHDGNNYTDTQNVPLLVQWVAANVDTGGTVDVGQTLDDTVHKLPCRPGEVTGVGFENLPLRVTIRGTVRDETILAVVPNATVEIPGTGNSDVSDSFTGRFQLPNRVPSGSTITLRVTATGFKATNWPYLEVPSTAVDIDVMAVSAAYFDPLVTEIATEHVLTVDPGKGAIVGAVTDFQPFLTGPGKVDGATVGIQPASGVLDYVGDDGAFGNDATNHQTPSLAMFLAVNVDPGDVTVTEDWDGTDLDCPVRAGEVTIAAFTGLTPQSSIWGFVNDRSSVFNPVVPDADVEAYDEEGNPLGSARTDGSGFWRIDRLRAPKRLYLSASALGFVTTNSLYIDVDARDVPFSPAVYSETFRLKLEGEEGPQEGAWEAAYGYVPDRSAYGALMGVLRDKTPANLAGQAAQLVGQSVEVGYLDTNGAFVVVDPVETQADPRLSGLPAPQFHMLEVDEGNYVLEQSGDGKIMRVPVRTGEYTYVTVRGISTTAISISGTVTDGTNTVAGAVVSIPETPYSTVTDNSGTYTLSGVPARSWITLSVSKDGATINIPYLEAAATDMTGQDLFFIDPVTLDILVARFEAEIGPVDGENKAIIIGSVERAGAPVEGLTVSLSPSAGDTGYFDEYGRLTAVQTAVIDLQYIIGNVEPGDAVLTPSGGWPRVELPCRAGEWTLGSVDLRN